ncbi:hypothetical protein GWI33_012606 [Rhynchophorus ferrugineus]|uniref:Odorant receptor n=1 Tax=Rhynchophorus ferrugineus TaxID=354439 RepID=A0A834IIE4_RHYFE|nr:hypothetical protein GWI33_012606 [Rhynchophorus ferrugineus]
MSLGVILSFIVVYIFKYFQLIQAILASISISSVVLTFSFELYNTGQHLEDQFELIYCALANMPWYLWDRRNKQIYFLLIAQMQKDVSIYVGLNTQVNRKSFIMYGKFLYAAFNYFYQIR